MSDWNSPEYTNEDLASILSDYHKDVHGYRLRAWGEPRSVLVAHLEALDQYMARGRETFEGREALREQGWHIEETDPELKQRAAWLKQERDREEDAFIASFSK
jgi:hypothetical protein